MFPKAVLVSGRTGSMSLGKSSPRHVTPGKDSHLFRGTFSSAIVLTSVV